VTPMRMPAPASRAPVIAVGRLLACTLTLALAASALADRVERRGRAEPITGTVTRVGDDGVEITTALDARHLVPWDRVRRVESERHAARVAALMPTAESIWRARSRVERGDLTLAEPLFDRLFERYRGQSNETALVIAEGLLRCRLARGEQAGAVAPLLEVVRLRRVGFATDSYAALAPVVDPTTLLCPLLPPLLPEGPALERLRNELAEYADAVVSAMASAYAAAPVVRRDGTVSAAQPLAAVTGEAASHPGVAALVGLVRGSIPGDERGAALDAVRSDLARQPAFVSAWLTFFEGVALLDDAELAMNRRGVVRLLAVDALHGRRQPWLGGCALMIAAAAEARVGDPAVATILQRELQGNHSHHPLVSAPPRRTGSTPAP